MKYAVKKKRNALRLERRNLMHVPVRCNRARTVEETAKWQRTGTGRGPAVLPPSERAQLSLLLPSPHAPELQFPITVNEKIPPEPLSLFYRGGGNCRGGRGCRRSSPPGAGGLAGGCALRVCRDYRRGAGRKKFKKKIKNEIVVSCHSSCQCLSAMAALGNIFFHKILGRSK